MVELRVSRGDETLRFAIKTIGDPLRKGRAIVGFTPDQAADIKLPLNVQIDAGNVGGPSAGLAFALEVMEKLGHKLARGYRVAATGQIELNGGVTPIGGIQQKVFGVREAGVDLGALRERTAVEIGAWQELGRGLATRFLAVARDERQQ